MAAGCHKFNSTPAAGISYLMQHGLLRGDPDQVARLLHSCTELDAAAIGQYLSHSRDFSRDVLAEYVRQLRPAGLLLVPALRVLLSRLQLPGDREGAIRILRCFSEEYCRLNPDMFEPADAPYVCDYMLVLCAQIGPEGGNSDGETKTASPLNTPAQSRDHPVTQTTAARLEGAPVTAGAPNEPARVRTSQPPRREGWLYKQGGRVKTWKLRWFVLQDNNLLYFKERTDRAPRGSVLLENLQLRTVHDPDKINCFELHMPVDSPGGRRGTITAWKRTRAGIGSASGNHAMYRMSADTEEGRRDWMVAIQRSIVLRTLLPDAAGLPG